MKNVQLAVLAVVSAGLLWLLPVASEELSMNKEKTVQLPPLDSNEDLRAKPESFWKERLSPEQYRVCRQAGTERPFSGTYCNFKIEGSYSCAACGQSLFSSENKFDSGTGWPSFTEATEEGALELREDNSHGMRRTEVICNRCGSHLGHVFDDGPPPTHKRFCINSLCLTHTVAEGAE